MRSRGSGGVVGSAGFVPSNRWPDRCWHLPLGLLDIVTTPDPPPPPHPVVQWSAPIRGCFPANCCRVTSIRRELPMPSLLNNSALFRPLPWDPFEELKPRKQGLCTEGLATLPPACRHQDQRTDCKSADEAHRRSNPQWTAPAFAARCLWSRTYVSASFFAARSAPNAWHNPIAYRAS